MTTFVLFTAIIFIYFMCYTDGFMSTFCKWVAGSFLILLTILMMLALLGIVYCLLHVAITGHGI